MTCPICRASVIPKFAFGKAVRRISAESRLSRQTSNSVATANSFESERDKPRLNEVQRSQSYPQPQQHAEKKRAPAHLFQRGAGDPAADEEQCCREAETSEMEESVRKMCVRRKICAKDSRENKERDEPGKLETGAVMFNGRSGEGERNDPESAGEFYGGADDQGLWAVFRGGADDGAGVVDRQRCPESELRLRKMEGVPDGRKNQQGDRIQNKNRAEGYRHFLFLGLKNGTNRGDGAAAANR